MPELAKAYNPKDVEDEIYQKWEKSGYFNPDKLPRQGSPFSIVMPPPNVTGTLHLGHAVMLAVEDILIRYHRMKGDRALWLPGTDHAAIATQTKVEKLLKEREGKSRHDLGREKFLAEVEKFIIETKGTIKNQIRKMGSSCDWSREAYTLDEQRSLAVRTVFKMMHDDGLIYRGERIVNWCPRCGSTLADDEVEYKPTKTKLYWIKYGPFILATTRPETKLGDTAVAVHPGDKRYKHMVGKKFMIPGVLGKFEITVVADKSVDPDFGSGAIKVTPAHSFIDNEIAQRHGVPAKQIIDEKGRMMANCGKYAGMTTFTAREAIVADMKKMGLIDHIDENYENNLAVCYRCGTTIEPIPSKQWFINVNKKFKVKGSGVRGHKKSSEATLKQLAIAAVKSGQIKILPDRFEKVYYHWMENLRDWCVSRQIWFGHRIPVWYCEDCREIKVTELAPTEIFLMRHGESRGNLLDQLNSDISEQKNGLTEKGKKMVRKTAEKIKNDKFSAIYCSDFLRTKETAAIVNEYFHLPIIEDMRLREVGVGEFEGKSNAELEDFREKNFEAWRHASPKGIESFDSLQSRVFEFIEEIKTKYPGQKVLVIAHGDVCRMAQGFGKNISDKDNFFKLTYPELAGFLTLNFPPIVCNCGSSNLRQDEDTLDTWFSSGLWTFTTLGWPEKNKDFKTYHPTSVLETGYDILFFWIARMILMTTYVLGDIPFDNVYLHGMVRDEKGRKMSKSLGNIIDPLSTADKYGTDAVRLSLVIGTSPGSDTRLYDEKIAGFRNFTNKLWNIGRYVAEKTEGVGQKFKLETKTLAEKWIFSRLNNITEEVTEHLEKLEFSQAGEKLRSFTWDEFADWYLEINKIQPNPVILAGAYSLILKLWHPFMPYVTEALWPNFGNGLLMVSIWPKVEKRRTDKKAEKDFEILKNIVTSLRGMRADYKIEPAKKISAVICGGKKGKFLKEQAEIIKALARLENLEIKKSGDKPERSAGAVVAGVEIYLPLAGLVDFSKEKVRLEKELGEAEKYLASLGNKLSNEAFLENAPKELVAGEKEKLDAQKEKVRKIKDQLESLS